MVDLVDSLYVAAGTSADIRRMINTTLDRTLADKARSTMCAVRLLLTWSRGTSPLAAEARLKLARFQKRESNFAVDEIRQDAEGAAKPNVKTVVSELRRIGEDYVTPDDPPTDIQMALRNFLREDMLADYIAGRFTDRRAYLTVEGAPEGFDEALAELVNILPTDFWQIAQRLARRLRTSFAAKPIADGLVRSVTR